MFFCDAAYSVHRSLQHVILHTLIDPLHQVLRVLTDKGIQQHYYMYTTGQDLKISLHIIYCFDNYDIIQNIPVIVLFAAQLLSRVYIFLNGNYYQEYSAVIS